MVPVPSVRTQRGRPRPWKAHGSHGDPSTPEAPPGPAGAAEAPAQAPSWRMLGPPTPGPAMARAGLASQRLPRVPWPPPPPPSLRPPARPPADPLGPSAPQPGGGLHRLLRGLQTDARTSSVTGRAPPQPPQRQRKAGTARPISATQPGHAPYPRGVSWRSCVLSIPDDP